MKKLFITMMSIVMVVAMMPTMAFATTAQEAAAVTPDPQVQAAADPKAEAFKTSLMEGGMVKLTENIDASAVAGMVVDSGVNTTLDLAGHQLKLSNSSVGKIHVKGGTLTLIDSVGGGKIWCDNDYVEHTCSGGVIQVDTAGTFNMNGGTIETDRGSNANGHFAVTVFDGSTVNLNGGTIKAGWYAVSGNGTSENLAGANINVNGAELISVYDYAIYTAKGDKVNIQSGKVSGGAGAVAMNSGSLTVSGGELSSSGTGDTGNWSDGTGNMTKNVLDFEVKYGAVTANITGGTFIANNSVAIFKKGAKHTVTLNVTGGAYSTYPEAEVTDPAYVKFARQDKLAAVGPKANPSSVPHSAGMNTWTWNEAAQQFEESYVAPYIPSTPAPAPAPQDNVTNQGTAGGNNASTNADLGNSTTTVGGTTTSTVDKTTADKIVDNAVANKSEEVVLDATASSAGAADKTTSAEVKIPTETLGAIADKTTADVTIKTDVAEVTLDNKTVEEAATQAKGTEVKLVVEKVKGEDKEVKLELKLVSNDGTVISDFKGGKASVTVPVPKVLQAAKKLLCLYMADSGRVTLVEGRLNADGTFTFVTGHFSTYVIMAAEDAQKALDEQKIADVKATKLAARSQAVTLKSGKKAIKVTWKAKAGDLKNLDGVQIFRSTKKANGTYKKVFVSKSGKYVNSSVKRGQVYYYKVRGFARVDGKLYFTNYSTKAWRRV